MAGTKKEVVIIACSSVLALAAFILALDYIPESTFILASESRLPKWITLPQGFKRSEVSLTMSYTDMPLGDNVLYTLQDRQGHTLAKARGSEGCRKISHLSLRSSGPIQYPNYNSDRARHRRRHGAQEDGAHLLRPKCSSCPGGTRSRWVLLS